MGLIQRDHPIREQLIKPHIDIYIPKNLEKYDSAHAKNTIQTSHLRKCLYISKIFNIPLIIESWKVEHGERWHLYVYCIRTDINRKQVLNPSITEAYSRQCNMGPMVPFFPFEMTIPMVPGRSNHHPVTQPVLQPALPKHWKHHSDACGEKCMEKTVDSKSPNKFLQ